MEWTQQTRGRLGSTGTGWDSITYRAASPQPVAASPHSPAPLPHSPAALPTARRRFPQSGGRGMPRRAINSASVQRPASAEAPPRRGRAVGKFSQRAATRVSRCAAAPSVYDWQLRVQRTVISLQCGPRCSAECDPTPLGARPPDDGYSADEEDRWSGRVSGRVRVRRRGPTGPRAPRGRSLVVLRPWRGALRTRRCAVDSNHQHRRSPPHGRAGRRQPCARFRPSCRSKIKCIECIFTLRPHRAPTRDREI